MQVYRIALVKSRAFVRIASDDWPFNYDCMPDMPLLTERAPVRVDRCGLIIVKPLTDTVCLPLSIAFLSAAHFVGAELHSMMSG